MATLTIQKVNLTGLSPVFAAASAGGDDFVNSGKCLLHVKNGDIAEKTVTINSQKPCNYGFDHDLAIIVPAGGEKVIGTFDIGRFNGSEGKISITYSDVTSVTVAVTEV